MRERILVAESDAPLAEFLCLQLHEEHFSVQVAVDGREAQRFVSEQPFDLALLDLGAKGREVLSLIRATKPHLPVLVAGNVTVEERIRGLDAGADDYLVKPFAFAELSARIRAILRRGNQSVAACLRIQDLQQDRINHTVCRNGRPITLSPKEFALLEFLMRHEGLPVSRAAILQQIWKPGLDSMTNVVDVYINYLRRKVDFGSAGTLIRTVRGIGYQIGGMNNPV
jgi:two-component system OmpR family response regulator